MQHRNTDKCIIYKWLKLDFCGITTTQKRAILRVHAFR
jgi:hypothetical protein